MAGNDNSRLDFSLDSANGDYFDEVLAMSQEIINLNFEYIHSSNKLLQNIHYDPPRLNTQFKAETLPPKIVLQAHVSTNASTAFYVIRIKKGTIKLPGVNDPLTIDGWEFASEVTLGDITLRRVPREGDNLDAEDKKARQRQLDEIYKTFLVPGDYSVQRLYAALSSASWVRLNEDLTYCGSKDGQKIPFSTFKKQRPEYASVINSALTTWSLMMESKGLNNLGLQFKLPEDKVPENCKPTFVPFELITQTYPYKTPNFGPKTGYDGLCGNNCLLYCETVDGRKMGDNVLLGWNGNMAMPRSHRGIGNKVEGTFALHHKVILEKLILLQLQGLCQACELIVLEPGYNIGNNGQSFSPRYSLGRQPSGTPDNELRSASDSYFEYSRIGGENPSYVWTKAHEHARWDDPVPYAKPNATNELFGYSRHKISSLAKVEVSWTPDTPTLHVNGSTTYKFNLEFGNDKEFTIGRSWKTYHLVFPWQIDLEVSTTPEGVMDITLKKCSKDYKPDNLHAVEVEYKCDGIEGTTKEAMLGFMEENLKPKIQRIIENLRKELETCGRFNYPGHGQLKFGSPFWGKKGNLLADVTYAPPPPGQQIAVPDVQKNLPTDFPVPDQKINEEPITAPKVLPLLKWINRSSYDPKTKRTTLQITISNPTEQILYFQYLRIAFLLNSQHKAIFNGTDFKYTRPQKKGPIKAALGALSDLVRGKTPQPAAPTGATSTTTSTTAPKPTGTTVGTTTGTTTGVTAVLTPDATTASVKAVDPWAEPPLEDDASLPPKPVVPGDGPSAPAEDDIEVITDEAEAPSITEPPKVTSPPDTKEGATGDAEAEPVVTPVDPISTIDHGPDPKATGNTYFWVSNKVVGPDVYAESVAPGQDLELNVWGKADSDYADRFHFMPHGSITLTLSGPGEPGKYRFQIHESWKDGNEDPWFSSTGDADQTFEVIVKQDEEAK